MLHVPPQTRSSDCLTCSNVSFHFTFFFTLYSRHPHIRSAHVLFTGLKISFYDRNCWFMQQMIPKATLRTNRSVNVLHRWNCMCSRIWRATALLSATRRRVVCLKSTDVSQDRVASTKYSYVRRFSTSRCRHHLQIWQADRSAGTSIHFYQNARRYARRHLFSDSQTYNLGGKCS